MIYSAIVGIILGLNHVHVGIGAPVLLALVALKGVAEVVIRKNPITGTPSPYVLYLEKLQESAPLDRPPWDKYMLQVLFFGGIIGFATYGICHFIF